MTLCAKQSLKLGEKMQSCLQRITRLAMFVAVASVLHVVESYFPIPLPIPGLKLGLANTVSLIIFVLYNWRVALCIVVLRVCIGSVLGGTILGLPFFMSLSGSVLSALAMAFAYSHWHERFSVMGVSILGAAVHNLTQISVAALLVSSVGIFLYLPYLILFAIPMGLFTGTAAHYFLKKYQPFISTM